MDLNLNYSHAENIGYGRLGVKLHEALTAQGVDVFDYFPSPPGMTPDPFGSQGRDAGLSANVCWVAIPSHAMGWRAGQHTSVFTMWEGTRLPEQFRECLYHFDTVIVPSDHNVELFSRFHPNVKRAYLGVDPADWSFRERRDPGMFFNFLIGGSGLRKGTDVAFEAFTRAFPTADANGPIPRLVMKNPRGESWSWDGRVEVIPGKLTAEEERELYASAHCYLQPSRGEGFGLQPLQALAQGCPTILTDAHGHESFAQLGYGIESDLVPAAYFIYGDAGDWWEPKLDDLVDAMRYVYANYDKACEKAKVAAAVIARDFTWANTAEQFMGALDLTATLGEPGEWVLPETLKFRIRTVKDWRCDIAGRRLVFKAGVDYWELADVKRILAECALSGDPILDMDCLVGDDTGLLDEQVARLGATAAGLPFDPELVDA